MLWKICSKEPLFLSEVKAGQKQGVGLKGSRFCSSLGAELMEGSSRKGETLQGAQVLQHCSPLLAQGEQQLSQHHLHPLSGKEEAWPKKNEVEAHFLGLSQPPELPMCFSLCVLVSYARECLDPLSATQILFFVPSAEGPAWPVFACGVTRGFSP